jgi:hypothetical protein
VQFLGKSIWQEGQMLALKVQQVREGQHPSEVVIRVTTAEGQQEELIVDKRSVKNNRLRVGYAVGSDNNRLLVELPRETIRGVWRIWVPREDVEAEAAA